MSTPVMTFNAEGNIRASASLAASASTSDDVDVSGKFELRFIVKGVGGGTVAATNGLKIQIYERFGASGVIEATDAHADFTIPMATSTTKYSKPIRLPPGKYRIKLTNLDATNAITTDITSATVDSIAP